MSSIMYCVNSNCEVDDYSMRSLNKLFQKELHYSQPKKSSYRYKKNKLISQRMNTKFNLSAFAE